MTFDSIYLQLQQILDQQSVQNQTLTNLKAQLELQLHYPKSLTAAKITEINTTLTHLSSALHDLEHPNSHLLRAKETIESLTSF